MSRKSGHSNRGCSARQHGGSRNHTAPSGPTAQHYVFHCPSSHLDLASALGPTPGHVTHAPACGFTVAPQLALILAPSGSYPVPALTHGSSYSVASSTISSADPVSSIDNTASNIMASHATASITPRNHSTKGFNGRMGWLDVLSEVLSSL